MSWWDERYKGDEFLYGTAPNDFLRSHASRLAPHSRVLCLAEGEGRNAVFLAGLGHHVTAVDGSAVGLAKMKRLAQEKNVAVEAHVADLAHFPIEADAWDAIVSIWCHVPPTLRAKLHRDCVAGLKAGGVFLLESYHPRQLHFKTGGPSDPELMMTVESLTAELQGLHFDVLHEIEREVHEGHGHGGPSAVVQALAHK